MWESVPEPIHLKILAIIDRYERRRGEQRRAEERRGGRGEREGWEVRCGKASPPQNTRNNR